MQIRFFFAVDYPAIAAVHSNLGVVWPERPRTAEAWAEVDRSRNPKLHYQRFVAVDAGEAVAFASYGQSAFDYHPQRFYVNVEAGPASQRRGIGAALQLRAIAYGAQHGYPLLKTCTAIQNTPMQALDKLRFARDPEWQQCQRDIPA